MIPLIFAALVVQEPPPPSDRVIFSINVQDFSYPEESAKAVARILEIHERHKVPVDFYLTTTMTDLFGADLMRRLRESPVASVCYHVRPPKPYYLKYDWAGLSRLTPSELRKAIVEYETHGLDLATGRPTDRPGGYAKLKEAMGYAPLVVAAQTDPALGRTVAEVFREMGARFAVQHGRSINLGDKRDGLHLRPEHADLKLFEHVGEPVAELLARAFAEARRGAGAKAPYFVGVKMHDNDFFAEKSAWVTVYARGARRPDWDVSRKSPLLAESAREAVWKQYEAAVAHVAASRSAMTAVNSRMLLAMIEGKPSKLHVSGTMHIETKRESWPDPDRLIEFFRRATAAGKSEGRPHGMRWSVGADIGWLEGEPRAAEAIRATEAMGVEWDIHAHRIEDRARCAETIRRLGGHPNAVASGAIVRELEALGSGKTWRAEIVWGLVLQPNHRPGSDDRSFGVWRPKSAREWTVHDPDGTLIAVGGGTRRLADAEAMAGKLADGGPPVVSASIMVSPRTFAVVGTKDGIEAIEAWAKRMAARPGVEWATIRETAEAWGKAGGVPSRME
ncbi:MAG: hypothetical protein HYY17_02845 [Planctomycetes bacterium]|nr:hypothetical protein [Planctomycetota bacterium]